MFTFHPMLSSTNFTVLLFTFSSITCVKLIFVWCDTKAKIHHFLYGCLVFLAPSIENTVFLPLLWSTFFIINPVSTLCETSLHPTLFSGPMFLPCSRNPLHLCRCAVLIRGSTNPPTLSFFLDYLRYPQPFALSYKF